MDETKIVVNSILQPQIPITFHLSTTTSITDVYNDTFRLFYVQLYEEKALLLDTAVFGGVTETDFAWKPKTAYRIKVKSDSLPTVWVEDSVPSCISIQAAKFIPEVGVDEYGDTYSRIEVSFKDPSSIQNYYELIIRYGDSSRWSFWHYGDGGVDLPVIDPVLQNEGDLTFHPASYFFSDELFNGKYYNIRINGGGGTYKLKAKLRSVSKNYYLYQKYYARHNYNQQFKGDFWETIMMSEPQNMYTNVFNGYGILAGYTEHEVNVTK